MLDSQLQHATMMSAQMRFYLLALLFADRLGLISLASSLSASDSLFHTALYLAPPRLWCQRRFDFISGKRINSRSNEGEGVLSRVSSAISQSPVVYKSKAVASDAAYVTKRLRKSTGKAAWISGTTFLILFVPLIIEMDREQQFNELDMQQASLLGDPAVRASVGPPK